MAVPVVTPRVARIHYDSSKQQWHLSISELKKSGTGTYTAPELKEVFESLTALLQVLLQFWLLAGPAETAQFNAPRGSVSELADYLTMIDGLGSMIFSPDPAIG